MLITTSHVYITLALLVLTCTNTPLCAQEQSQAGVLKTAGIVILTLLGGKIMYGHQPASAATSCEVATPVQTTIINATSRLPIENVTGAIASFRAHYGPSECTLEPVKSFGNTETLELRCHPSRPTRIRF